MKLKSVALFVGACCGLALPAISNATESFGFHGYIRAGSMFDAKDDFAKAGYEYEMDKTMGRLGSELDNSWEGGLNKLWELGGNKSVNIHFKVESD
ncbi:carbohydrate porin, partial [Aeromonas salmonicida]